MGNTADISHNSDSKNYKQVPSEQSAREIKPLLITLSVIYHHNKHVEKGFYYKVVSFKQQI